MILALRQAWRRPAFPLIAITLLSLGLGAAAAFFAALDALEWRPLPFREADAIRVVLRDGKQAAFAQETGAEMGGGIGFRTWGLTAADGRPLQVILAGMMTPGFFRFLGVEPQVGRAPRAGDRREVWLSHALWRTRFEGDPRAVGRVVALNEEPYTIAGILPPDFTFGALGREPDLYFPLPPGQTASLVLTRAPLDAVRAAAARAGDARSAALGIGALKPVLTGEAARPYRILLAATGALLAITCLNLAGLLLARSLDRRREWATRLSLGARQATVVRQFAAEALLLAGGGVAGAMLVAQFALARLELDGLFAARLDLRVLGALGAAALGIIALFTAGPALWLKRQDLFRRGDAPEAGRWRNAVVAAQVALSLALLTAAGLLLRSFDRLTQVDPGFRADHVILSGIGLPEVRYDTDAKLAGFHRAALARLSEIPGVEAAAGGLGVPFAGAQYRTRFLLDGVEASAEIGLASPELFRALSVPLLAGRGFSSEDSPGRARVVLVNQAFARAFYPGRSPLGEPLKLSWWGPSNPRFAAWNIVGIVGDIRTRQLERPAEPRIWLPLAQFPSEGLFYVVRTKPGADVGDAMIDAVAGVDGALERLRPRPLASDMAQALAPRRLTLRVTTAFALAALLVCAFGIFSVSAFAARARRRECAIRASLGETRQSLLRRLLLAHAKPVAVGVAGGLLLSTWTTAALESQVFATRPFEAAVLLPVLLGLIVTAGAAAWAPAWKASGADPALLLKED